MAAQADSRAVAPRRILLTGAAGAVGTYLLPVLLARGHAVRGFDRVPMPAVADAVVGELADPAALARACDGCDTLIHLAAYPNDADFLSVLLEPNIVGLHHAFEQARLQGVRRIIVASSIQVINGVRTSGKPIAADVNAPTNLYGVTKLFAEEYLRMYHLVHGIEGVAVRLGWFLRSHREKESLHQRPALQDIFVSHDDAGRFFTRCVEAEDIGYLQAFALSLPTGGTVYDMEPGRRVLGYEPQNRFPDGLPESLNIG